MVKHLMLAATCCVAALGIAPAAAQDRPRAILPAEVPPASFEGIQYVDSAGCVFLRVGFNGGTNWVPRFNQDRTPMCGRQPSLAPAPETVVAAAEPAPEAAPRPQAERPAAAPQPAPRTPPRAQTAQPPRGAPAPAPVAVASAAPAPAPAAGSGGGSSGLARVAGAHPSCPPEAPYGAVTRRADGVQVVECHALDLAATHRPAAAPRAHAPAPQPAAPQPAAHRPAPAATAAPRVAGAHPSCPPHAPYGAVTRRPDGVQVVHCHALAQAAAHAPAPVAAHVPAAAPRPMPEGYAPVWDDDRLNPHRARGTAAGEAQMRQIWTAETPMRLVDEPRRGVFGTRPPQQVLAPAASGAIRQPYGTPGAMHVSSAGSLDAPAAATGGRFVQVGSFGVPANAASTAARLQARGLPVAQQAARTGGRTLQVVLAGPFGSDAEARQALSAARGMGFHDAFIR